MCSLGGLARRSLPALALRAPVRRLTLHRSYATLLVAEHDNKTLNKATWNVVTAAKQLPGSDRLDVLVLGQGCGAVAKEASELEGVDRVLLVEAAQFLHPMADTTAELLLGLQKANGYAAIAGVAGSLFRETLPRLAAALDVQPVTDIIGVGEDGVFNRPMYAGNAIATVKSSDSIRILTFRPTAFEAAASASAAAPVEVTAAAECSGVGIEWISDSEKASDKPQLSSAGRVVSGGRGLKSAENFATILEPLCDKLKAAMGASRAAVDAGMAPNELQVGQTGKVVAPELYIAVGISGAIQHLAGMKDSKTIVAINKDADAPIFQVADYGLVGDLFEKVPELSGKL
eukprot:CAMPEP_0170571818 /NCGR_PEP_ID=MMETSP0224-20130122/1886_1 /TAXON_ID=285029 /ORGANISM="Togula jolla, Strain CCCM 725" /LENGTH=344 /DNA_ID=CAMNT_0010894267 /DNA_START=11 /DNA_END=1045 /DNA_ORIENTATION=-